MTSRRVQKAAEAIREVVSMAILTDLNDPRIRNVTVTYVEVSPDMRHAKVHVSIMGDESQQKLTFHGLESAAGYLQSKIAKQIETRYTPRLQFMLDMGVKRSIEMAKILKEVLPKDGESAEGESVDTLAPSGLECDVDDAANSAEDGDVDSFGTSALGRTTEPDN